MKKLLIIVGIVCILVFGLFACNHKSSDEIINNAVNEAINDGYNNIDYHYDQNGNINGFTAWK